MDDREASLISQSKPRPRALWLKEVLGQNRVRCLNLIRGMKPRIRSRVGSHEALKRENTLQNSAKLWSHTLKEVNSCQGRAF